MSSEEFHEYCINSINKYYDITNDAYFLFENDKMYFQLGEFIKIIDKIKNDEEFYDIDSVNINLVHEELHQKWLTINSLFRDYLAVETGFPL